VISEGKDAELGHSFKFLESDGNPNGNPANDFGSWPHKQRIFLLNGFSLVLSFPGSYDVLYNSFFNSRVDVNDAFVAL